MSKIMKEIVEEIKTVLKGKTLDALIPSLLFFAVNSAFGLLAAATVAMLYAFIIIFGRILQSAKIIYALSGAGAVILSLTFVLVRGAAKDYLLPDLIGNGLFAIGILVSLIMGKPMAALASHITRGWSLDWFSRKDIRPAYTEVTLLWLIYFTGRFILQYSLYVSDQIWGYVWVNNILGMPMNILVLTISYIYGIWRLRKLGGPGIDEFLEEKAPPYRGQIKGF